MTSIVNVQDITPRAQYTALASQTAFTYPFPIFEDDNLVVYDEGALQALNTDYTVSGAGDDNGGTVTFASGRTAGHVITIYRDIPIERLTDFSQNGPNQSSTMNNELDRITLVMQQLESEIKRCLRLAKTVNVADADIELSPISNWLDRFVYIGSTGAPEPATSVTTNPLSQSIIGGLLYPQTAAESSASLTPISFQYPEGWALRYSNDISAGVALAETLNGLTGPAEITVGPGTYTLTAALRITRWRKKLIVSPGAKIIVPSGLRGIEIDGGAGGIQQIEVHMLGEIEGQASSLDGIYAKNIGKCKFLINDIHAMGRDGIRLDQGIISTEFNFRRIQGCSGWGLNMAGNSASNGVIANVFEGEVQACTSGGMLAFYALGNRINIVSEGHSGPGLVLDSSLYNNVKSYFEANGAANHDVIFRATGTLECAFNEITSPTSFHDTKGGAAWNIDLQNGSGSTVHDNTIGLVFTTGSGQILRVGSAITATYVDGGRIPAASITNNAAASQLTVRRQSSNTFDKITVEGAVTVGTAVSASADGTADIGSNAVRFRDLAISGAIRFGTGAPIWLQASGTPEGSVTAPVGSLYTRTNGGAATTLYVKESGVGNTGWVAK